MKNLIKKNQLMITALAIMLAIAGYLQFAGTNLDQEYLTADGSNGNLSADAQGVITDNIVADTLAEIDSLDSDMELIVEDYLEDDITITQVAQVEPAEGEIPGEAVFTSTGGVTILAEARLLKEQVRAKNKETLLEIINSDGIGDEQKQQAVNTMVSMTDVAEKEAAAEILLEAKGFTDVVVSINGNSVDVVVNSESLSDAQRAQIEDIVKRKTGVPAENIIISTVVQ